MSTLALAGLAFVGQLKTSAVGTITWPASVTIGIAMITVLAGWLALANHWWSYANAEMFRMAEIETLLGMYLIRETLWLRKPLTKSQIAQLGDNERARYESVHESFPGFPKLRWRQRSLSSIIVSGLILIWIFLILADVLSLI